MNTRTILRYSILVVALAAPVTASGCSKANTSDIKSQFVAAPNFQLSEYKTFGWYGGSIISKDPLMAWSGDELDFVEETKFLIDENLRRRGLTVSTEPDLFVSFILLNDTKELKEVETTRASGLPQLAGIGEGALLIELVDAKTGSTAWLGAATAETDSGRSTEVKKARLRHAVEELLSNADS